MIGVVACVRHRRIYHLLLSYHSSFLRHSSTAYIYCHCMSLRTVNPVLRTCKSIYPSQINGNSPDNTGLRCPQIRLSITRSKFTPTSYNRPFTTNTAPSSKMSAPTSTPQAPQTPLVGSGTDYSSLVQGSTDPTDTSLVIRQVVPGMLTFSVPFVCLSFTSFHLNTGIKRYV